MKLPEGITSTIFSILSDDLFDEPTDYNPFEAINYGYSQSDWHACRAAILPLWIAQRPCSRPKAWWIFDAPENRTRVAGIDESQAAFLDRHNLLTPAERAHLFLHTDLLSPERVITE